MTEPDAPTPAEPSSDPIVARPVAHRLRPPLAPPPAPHQAADAVVLDPDAARDPAASPGPGAGEPAGLAVITPEPTPTPPVPVVGTAAAVGEAPDVGAASPATSSTAPPVEAGNGEGAALAAAAGAVALAERPDEVEVEVRPGPDPEPEPPAKPRRHLVATRPWRTVGVLAVVVAVLLLVPMLVMAAARTIGNSTEGELDTGSESTDPGQPGVAKAVLPDTPGALVTLVDDQGVPAGLAVFALSPTGAGGTVVVVPTGTEVTAADGSSSRLGDALAEGEEAQLAAVEGFLGVTLGRSEVLDQAALTEVLAPLAPFAVDLPNDVEVDGATGPTVVLEAGTQTLTAADAATVLTARTSVGTELDRLPNQVAVWQAVARRASEAAPLAEAPELGPDAKALVANVLAAATSVAEIPVEPVLDPVRNPGGLDLLAPDVAATRLLMARVLPGAVSPASDGIRVRLLNPLGDPSLTYEAVGRLVYVGAHVIIASEVAGPAPEQSVIEFEAPDGEAEASRYAPIVGGATVRPADIDIDGVDATITLGESFRKFMADERARQTAATTTTTIAASSLAPSTSEP